MVRVLVVDDSATVRRVVRRTLEQAGYDVAVAVDGQDALGAAQKRVPDLVLVDFVMPRMNGLAFVHAMRGVHNLASVPVVLMSAKADRIGDGFLNQTGALDAITKPFSPEALLAVTGHALSRHAQLVSESMPTVPDGEDDLPPIGRTSQVPAEPDPTASETTQAELDAAESALRDRVQELAAQHAALSQAELFERVDALAALVPGGGGDVAISGELEHVPLGEALQMLTHLRQTGVLEVVKRGSRSARAVAICLRDGAVQLAIGKAQEQEFRLGRYLLREGLLDKEELELVLGRGKENRGLLGTRLVKLGYITTEELRGLLVDQTSELIYEALRWRRGGYRFKRFATRPEAEAANLGLGLSNLLMEGLRRVDEWRLIEEQIKGFDVVPRRDPEALRAFDPATLSPDERRVLQAIDGVRSVRAILEQTQLGSFDACKILFQLTTSRLVRV